MEPIINPMWFYLINLCDSITVFLIIGSLALFITRAIIISDYEDIEYFYYEKMFSKDSKEFITKKYELEKATHKRYIKNLVILFVGWSLAVITPSSETVTKMLIASQVTTDRVEKSVEIVEKVYNNILARIDKK